MSDSATPTGGPPTAPEGFIIPSGCPQYYPVYINMELIAKADCGFEPNMVVENTLMIFMIIAYVPPLILYIINKDNVLIKYRQPRSVFIAGILSGINSIFVPIIRMTGIKCIFNTWFCSSLIFSFVILTFSRYIKTYYMQRLSIFKLNFSNRKRTNKKETSKNDERNISKSAGIESHKAKFKSSETLSSIKTYSFISKDGITSNDITMGERLGITDPIFYFKRLNLIINKKITIYLVIIPLIVLIAYYTYITIAYWNPDKGSGMLDSCPNELKPLSYPKIVLNVIIILTSFYMFYEAYYNQKWDIELRIEYTTFVVVDIICFIVMQLTMLSKLGMTMLAYRVYIFQFFSLSIQIMCVIIPLIKVYMTKFKSDEGRLTKEEFLAKLSISSFREQVRDISNHTFCIENLLFFLAHCDLMNIVIQYYSKKGNNGNSAESTSFSSYDVLHRDTINSALYNPFESIFKKQFQQMYLLYIKEDGIASINIKSSTVKTIEEHMESDNYTYLMFNEAAFEVGELLYSNIYPRMY